MRDTDPLLVRIDMPASTGSTTAPMNVGATDNRSVSVRATYYIIKNGNSLVCQWQSEP